MSGQPALVIPDSVEPYIGYKWLGFTGSGTLYSHNGGQPWRENEPFEAVCGCDWGWHWTIAPTGKEKRAAKGWQEVYKGNSQYVKERCWILPDGTTFDEKPPKTPKIVLPAGWSYSYERVSCPHDPVAEECSCGIYAASNIKHTESYKRPNSVLVKVAIWGRTIIGTQGARGQYAYPQEVIDTTIKEKKHMEEVGRKYGIPFPGSEKPATAEPSVASPSSTELETLSLSLDAPITPTPLNIKPKKTGVWHSPGILNPGRKDAFTLTMSALMGALALGMFACALFCFYSAYQDLLALPFGLLLLLPTGLMGWLAGDMFCEGCGRKGWM